MTEEELWQQWYDTQIEGSGHLDRVRSEAVAGREDQMIQYLIDQLLLEYAHMTSNTSAYRLRQANTTIHNIMAWYLGDLPFDENLLSVYTPSQFVNFLKSIRDRKNQIKKSLALKI